MLRRGRAWSDCRAVPQGRIQEDNLQHLALFAEYGRLTGSAEEAEACNGAWTRFTICHSFPVDTHSIYTNLSQCWCRFLYNYRQAEDAGFTEKTSKVFQTLQFLVPHPPLLACPIIT